MTERVLLSLGGNLGDPAASMAAALKILDATPGNRVVAVSSLYRTPPWGKLDQPDFLNAAAALDTDLSPRDFLALCLEAERSLKRERRERWGPRLIDLDVLVYGRRTVSEHGLELPHPRMMDRAFVLAPLTEIAPDLVVDGVGIAQRLRELDSSGIVRVDASADWWRR